jgi:hypothetical protein
MVLMIILIILVAILAVLAFFFCVPISAAFSGVVGNNGAHGSLALSWLHPAVIRADIDIEKKSAAVFAFGRFRVFYYRFDQTVPPVSAAADMVDKSVSEKPLPAYEKMSPSENQDQQIHQKIVHEQTEDINKETPDAETSPSEDPGTGKTTFAEKLIPLKKVWIFAGNPSFRGEILRWIRRLVFSLFHTISVSTFRVRVKAGLEEPSLTAAAYGYYIGLKNILATGNSSRRKIMFEPVFNNDPFETDGEIRISTSVARLCLPLVLAVATFPYLHAVILYFKMRKIS